MADESRTLIDALRYGQVVSCRAHGDHPPRDSALIAALARCAQNGGAATIRATDGRTSGGSTRK